MQVYRTIRFVNESKIEDETTNGSHLFNIFIVANSKCANNSSSSAVELGAGLDVRLGNTICIFCFLVPETECDKEIT